MNSSCCSFLTRYISNTMMNMSSTLVETVSINYEDFNESFLTCGTCLCMYDGNESTPKLLPCSHTVCQHCLSRIAASQTRDNGTFRCPICRETITLPRGGVAALPPSFLVNQLLDLMSRQRREVIPQCSTHINQELLFCESCDIVFCTLCTGGSHSATSSSAEHTVIPFSIAIKRMSEILLYKANECISKLNQACDNVTEEMHRLDHNVDHVFELVNASFQEAISLVEKRRQEVLAEVKKTRDEKKKVLQEQLAIIQSEKAKVEQECEGLQYQVEVRNITKKIGDLSGKLDAVSTLSEPRENAFIQYEYRHNSSLANLQIVLEEMGRIRTSKTFPSLCRAKVDPAITNLETIATVTTVDYHGDIRTTGGDPVECDLQTESGENIECCVEDSDDGTYQIRFRPPTAGKYMLKVNIFKRPIKDCPIFFDVIDHNSPVAIFGVRGTGEKEFLQPVGVTVDTGGTVYVVDTGNSRIKVLSPTLAYVKHLEGTEGLSGRSGTGIAMSSSNSMVVVNWRNKMITEMSLDGQVIGHFSHTDLKEPVGIAVNRKGEVLVADHGQNCVFVFDPSGKLQRRIGKKGQISVVSSIAVGPQDEVIVADSRIQVFSEKGEFIREIYPEGKGKGHYGGVVVDQLGHIIATRMEKSRSYIQVFSFTQGTLLSVIDSHGAKLKRPSGLAVVCDKHIVVIDLGNDCVKKFRYM